MSDADDDNDTEETGVEGTGGAAWRLEASSWTDEVPLAVGVATGASRARAAARGGVEGERTGDARRSMRSLRVELTERF